ncbi:MAG: exonuclease SbcCD subunit D C-terminal domain-containing protein [Clostridia bacterium]|nr:exonuclease SbcCD subunit D C-terminal domain-containing protein [Clostridia bacterium]
MEHGGIYVSPVYNGDVKPIKLEDEYGKINIWLLPFVKPVHVRRFNEDEQIESYTDAMKIAIGKLNVNKNERNIMVTHQFVTGADRTESEEISVGGTDNVDVSVFDSFDYTALGHIHRGQNCKSQKVRYSGTPLKYSFSESKDVKSVSVVELKEKGSLNVKTVPLVPMRDMVEIKGKYNEIMLRDFYKNTSYQEDYVHITLTDEEDIPDAAGKLRTVYHNLMKLDYDNLRTRSMNSIGGADIKLQKSPLEHFAEFYQKQNNNPLTDKQSEFMKNLIEEIWEGEK